MIISLLVVIVIIVIITIITMRVKFDVVFGFFRQINYNKI